jgi:hypothetical protein
MKTKLVTNIQCDRTAGAESKPTKKEKTMNALDRRAFLKNAGKAGAAAGLGSLITSNLACTIKPQTPELPAWPWKYTKLDVEEIRKKVFIIMRGSKANKISGHS